MPRDNAEMVNPVILRMWTRIKMLVKISIKKGMESVTVPTGSTKICNYFMKGKCTKDVCNFFHGYSEILQHIDIEPIHEKPIVSVCQINDKKFITADESTIQVWSITAEDNKKLVGSDKFEGEKITKVIFSSEMLFVATQIEQMYENNIQ
jgi:hypothetical protein